MPEGPAQFTLLTAARLLDGVRREPVENAALLLEGAAVRGLGPRDAVRAPDGAAVQRMDYGDATILPGLVDAHTHLVSPGDGTPGDAVALEDDQRLLLQ